MWKFLNQDKSMPRLWRGRLEPSKPKIPKFIHQIWLGNKEKPTEWMQTWKDKHPDWEHIVWDETKINEFGLKNRHIYDQYYEAGCFNGCANIARTEILEKFGGIYIDADSVCETSMDGAPFLDWDIFSVYEADNLIVDGIRLIANGIIGATPHHQIIQKYIEEQGKLTEINPSWRQSGPLLWSKVMTQKHSVLPPYTFLPEHHSGAIASVNGTIYSRQFWGTSKNIYK
jgi:mannosyltransferase OCH1-like enzyme